MVSEVSHFHAQFEIKCPWTVCSALDLELQLCQRCSMQVPQRMQLMCRAPHPGLFCAMVCTYWGQQKNMVGLCRSMAEGRAYGSDFEDLAVQILSKFTWLDQCVFLIHQFLGPLLPLKWRSLPFLLCLCIHSHILILKEQRVIFTSWRKCRPRKVPLSKMLQVFLHSWYHLWTSI